MADTPSDGGGAGVTDLEPTLQEVSDSIGEVPVAYQTLVNNISSWGDWVPSWVWEEIIDTLEWLGDAISTVIVLIQEWLTYPGVPWTLWNHGTTWTEEIGGVASRWGGVFTAAAGLTDDEWSGTAATAYGTARDAHSAALAALKAATDQIDDTLGMIAVAIGLLWAALVAAVVSYAMEMTAAAGAAVEAPPAAVGAAAGSTGKVWALASGAISVLDAYLASSALGAVKDLNQSLHDNQALPHGMWPQLTSDISDSSHKENKGTNPGWEMTKA